MSLEVLAHRDAEGNVEYFSTTARNITERIELEQSLERQARHDPLTGLPNRTLLYERIREASAAIAVDPSRWISVLFIDLDHFKIINDSLGHTLGDQLLQAISHRILTVAGPRDVVGRFGGDEFVVLCEDVSDPAYVLDLARRVETTLETPFRLGGHDIHVGVSIGVADAPGESDPDVILRDADTAMYEAKSSGRGRLVVFDDELRRRAVDRQRTESALRASRDGGDLEVFYQPVLDLRTRTLRGTEALLRWHRDGELVPPEDFVTVAEETGLIVPIGRWVLEEACKQTAQWQQLPGWADLGISVNVSARQLQRPGFAGTVGDVLQASGLARGTLTLEITETVLVEDEVTVVAVLEALRAMGVHLAIDDFGTGYSSLTYLHRLPVDTVKLDRSFVAGVADDLQKRAIVTAVMTLTKALGLRSIAEGVETERELAELRILGCTAGQGHLISPALEASAIAPLLSVGHGRAGGPLPG
jgi:diguanylate cyclase (GGDEF)-like protein